MNLFNSLFIVKIVFLFQLSYSFDQHTLAFYINVSTCRYWLVVIL